MMGIPYQDVEQVLSRISDDRRDDVDCKFARGELTKSELIDIYRSWGLHHKNAQHLADNLEYELYNAPEEV